MRTALLVVAASIAIVPALATALENAAEAAGVDPSNATPVQRVQANARFVRGKALYDAKKYEEGLTEFRASFDIVASPNARLFAARCLRELGRLVEAYSEFGRTAVEGQELAKEDARYAKAGESAQTERAELEPKLGFVTVTVVHATDATKLKVGNEELRRAAWTEPAPVMPGSAEVSVETPGRSPVTKTVSLKAGEKAKVTIDALPADATVETPTPPPDEPKPEAPSERAGLRPIAYVAGGVGAAGLLTFAIAGLASSSTFNSLKDACHGPCPPSKSDDISSGKTQQTIANVGLVVGLVGVAAGVTLFVLSMPKRKADAAPTTSLVIGPTWIGVRGTL